MLNHRLDAGTDLLGIRIATIDHVQGQRVGAEEENDFMAILRRKAVQTLADGFAHRLDESWMYRPPVDQAPRERVLQSGPCCRPPELVEARPGGAAGKLGVLGECDGPLDAIVPHLAERVLALGPSIAEGNIELVRSRPG